ncbi:GNAT family N-acetyltransferase [Kitasatospora sp. NPDC088134]|uniref:GNAT family N-acetyltransferase n=1 Tax=Kitasatospora sp. NPDC088134 TaxID=3364071 RepID=UPI0038224E34
MDAPAQTPPHLIDLGDDGLPGLALRRFAGEADLPELLRVVEESLEHLRPWMPWVAEHCPALTAEFLAGRDERWASGAAFSYAIVLDGAIVGACDLFRPEDSDDGASNSEGEHAGAGDGEDADEDAGADADTGGAAAGREIGYWLHPAATGRGVATRAVRALVAVAFRLPGVEHVDIVHDPANLASGAVPARLGFTEHLRRPAEVLAPAETGEEVVWRLTRRQ